MWKNPLFVTIFHLLNNGNYSDWKCGYNLQKVKITVLFCWIWLKIRWRILSPPLKGLLHIPSMCACVCVSQHNGSSKLWSPLETIMLQWLLNGRHWTNSNTHTHTHTRTFTLNVHLTLSFKTRGMIEKKYFVIFSAAKHFNLDLFQETII